MPNDLALPNRAGMTAQAELLTPRWTPLRYHPVQQAYWRSRKRFHTLPAGRRSGKTELAKRKLVKRAIAASTPWVPRFFAGAPTRDQAKRIYWDDLKALVPRHLVVDISESDLMIKLLTETEIWVLGLDKPERIEGQPWDGGILDEYGNMKPRAWPENVRPALSDRLGWCDLIGVPEGRNHYYDLHRSAQAQLVAFGEESEWGWFTWKSADILPASEIEAARRDLDDLTFQQEYEASFINFEGRAYYNFDADVHAALDLLHMYNPRAPLDLCFDFNVDPGVCAIMQEMEMPDGLAGSGVIGEVFIPRNSNTPAVCRKVIQDWLWDEDAQEHKHQGAVRCFGDATGGARGSAKVDGSDWELIVKELRPVVGDRLLMRVKRENPRERARINAVNSRLKSVSGEVRLLVDPQRAPHVVKDLEGVSLLKGGSGEIDKKANAALTHISDAIGYRIEYDYPVAERGAQRVRLGGI